MIPFKPVVAVYRDSWLSPSEAFILEPTAFFDKYDTVGVGLKRIATHPAMQQLQLHLWDGVVTERSRAQLGRKGFAAGVWQPTLGLHIALVHAHFGPDALLARHLARDLDVPLVVSMHGYDVTKRDLDFIRDIPGRSYLLHRKLLRRDAAFFLPVSEYLRNEMVRKGWPIGRTIRHYVGVDADFWASQDCDRTPRTGRDLLFVGRLIELKGADVAIRAISQLRDEFADVRLHIIGDGPERANLEALADPLGSSVVFHGSQPRTRIKELMSQSRATVIPSRRVRGRREALNLVALETAAFGNPVVAYDSGGLSEVVRNGVTGFIVPEEDEKALTFRLSQVLGDVGMAQALGAKGRDMVIAEFSIRRQAASLEAIYDVAIAEHASRRARDV